jgi:hypothetical protein
MTNLTVWQTLIIAVIPAAITILNSWTLKLFEIKQAKAAPKKEPDAIREKNARKLRILNFFE